MGALVSVIMPCFNAGPMLEPALRSVFAQTHPDVEIIFVDNNSTDGSADRAARLAAGARFRFRLLRCAEQGANHARILGFAAARGDYIQWLDADDALGIEKIALQVRGLEADRRAGLAYCDWLMSRHEGDGRRHDEPHLLAKVDDQITRVLCGIWYPPHSYLVRRDAADALQREQSWWPGREVGTDVEYSAVAAMLGQRFIHVPGARVQYNIWSPTQTSNEATSYARRVGSLAAIYRRLGELARRPDIAPRITARHRSLLAVDWNVWTMPAGSVEARAVSARRIRLRHLASGRCVEARPREAAVAAMLMATGARQAIAHLALRAAMSIPAVAGDVPFALATLERFRREGLLTPGEA